MLKMYRLVDPKGSLPTWLVNTIITESPQLVGKAREYYESNGYLPLVTEEATSVVRFETFNHAKREWKAGFIGKAGDAFEVILDGARLYKDNGFKAVVEGPGKDGVTITTEGDRLKVAVGEAAGDKLFEIIVSKA